jgi:predicted  nucleic acid-binding Zn-ribbon protein
LSSVSVFLWGRTFYNDAIKEKQESLIQNAPHVWTALGVAGTFITLFIVLGIQDLPMNNDEIDILSLIKSLTSAFSTSIVGVIGSLVTSIMIKTRYEKLRHKQDAEWEQKDERELLFELTSLLKKQISNQEKTIEASNTQTKELKAELSTISNNITEIKNNIVGNVGTLLNELKNELRSHVQNIGNSTLEETKKLSKDINERYKEQLHRLINENDKVLKEALEQSQRNLNETSVLITSKVNETMSSFDHTINAFQDASKKLEVSINDYVVSTKTEFENISNQIKESAGYMNESVNKTMDNFNEKVIGVTEEYKTSFKTLNEQIINETSKILNSNLDKLKTSFEKLENYQISSQNLLQQTTKEFKESVTLYDIKTNEEKEILNNIQEQIKLTSETLHETKNVIKNHKSIIHLQDKTNKYLERVNAYIDKMPDNNIHVTNNALN